MSEEFSWDVRIPLVSNVYVLLDILIVLLVLSLGLAGIVLSFVGFDKVYDVLRVFVIADGFVILLLYSVMGFVFLNRFQLIYHIDSEGVQVRVGEFESSLNRAAWRVSSFVQRYSFTGGRVHSLMNEEHFTPWSSVTRYFYDPKHRVVSLTDDIRPLMRIYCTKDNLDDVLEFVKMKVPEPDE
ncbi:MAG: hypothetical protein NWF07_01880 [Candidatus Bathyarchaeota archaeon]|nr:hypothetical protein [Candidatus Bathyarchaeota archaeon]